MFPAHPSLGERFNGTRNRIFEWDGDKWRRYKKELPPLIEPLVTPVSPDIWPSDPITGERVVGLNGRTWQWDGEKWVGVHWVPASPFWERPSDRPAKPSMVDNTILMLYGVAALLPNALGFTITCVGGITVNWGDGSITQHASAAVAQHEYVFGDVSAPVDSLGYKMVWVTVQATTGANITVLNTNPRPMQIFEMYIQCPALTSLTWMARAHQLEIFSLDENSVTTAGFSNLLSSSYNLRHIEKLRTERATAVNSLMNSCFSYNEPLPEDFVYTNIVNGFLYGCQSFNQRFPDGVTFANIGINFMTNCSSYNQPFPNSVTFAGATTGFMNGTQSYNQPFPDGLIFQNVADQFLMNCSAFSYSVTVNLTGRTATLPINFIGSANYCQKGLRLLNMPTTINSLTIAATSMDENALAATFGDLVDRTGLGAGTVTITGAFGASRLSTAQRAIATNKNWTITG